MSTTAPTTAPPRPRLLTHPECGGCCALRRCHYCAGAADGLYSVAHLGATYFACAAHRDMLTAAVRNDPRKPNPRATAFPTSPLLS